MKIQFQTIDDFWTMQFSGGAFGEYSPYLVNINIVYGHLLSALSSFNASFPWFTSFLFLSILFALTAILYVFIYYSKNTLSLIIYTLLLASMIIPFQFQFTVIAYLSAIAGFTLWFSSGNAKPKSKAFQLWAAAFFIIHGALLRKEVLFSSSLLFLALLLAGLWQQSNARKPLKLLWGKHVFLIGFAIIISFFLWGLNNAAFINNSLYKPIKSISDRTPATDYNRITFAQSPEMYRSINWSENDYNMFYSCTYDDKFFSNENLAPLLTIKSEFISQKTWQDRLLSYWMQIEPHMGNIITAIFIISLIWGFSKNSRSYSLAIASTVLAVIFFLVAKERAVERVMTPQFLAVFVLVPTVYLILNASNENSHNEQATEKNKNRKISIIWIFTVIGIVLFVLTTVNSIKHSQSGAHQNYSHYRALVDYANANKNNLYIFDTYSFRNEAYSIYETPAFNQMENLIPSGDWWSGFGLNLKVKNKFNIKNTFTDATNKSNIYYIVAEKPEHRRAGNINLTGKAQTEMISAFLQKRYGLKVKTEVVGSFGKAPITGQHIYNIYHFKRISSEKKKNENK